MFGIKQLRFSPGQPRVAQLIVRRRMTLDALIDATSVQTSAWARDIDSYCAGSGLTLAGALDSIARAVARRYAAGTLGFTAADSVMNYVFAYGSTRMPYVTLVQKSGLLVLGSPLFSPATRPSNKSTRAIAREASWLSQGGKTMWIKCHSLMSRRSRRSHATLGVFTLLT